MAKRNATWWLLGRLPGAAAVRPRALAFAIASSLAFSWTPAQHAAAEDSGGAAAGQGRYGGGTLFIIKPLDLAIAAAERRAALERQEAPAEAKAGNEAGAGGAVGAAGHGRNGGGTLSIIESSGRAVAAAGRGPAPKWQETAADVEVRPRPGRLYRSADGPAGTGKTRPAPGSRPWSGRCVPGGENEAAGAGTAVGQGLYAGGGTLSIVGPARGGASVTPPGAKPRPAPGSGPWSGRCVPGGENEAAGGAGGTAAARRLFGSCGTLSIIKTAARDGAAAERGSGPGPAAKPPLRPGENDEDEETPSATEPKRIVPSEEIEVETSADFPADI